MTEIELRLAKLRYVIDLCFDEKDIPDLDAFIDAQIDATRFFLYKTAVEQGEPHMGVCANTGGLCTCNRCFGERYFKEKVKSS